MCGIAGIVAKGNAISPEQLATLAKKMADLMPYRGPDDSGVWLDPQGRCALSHRRLAIIDITSAGHQPMLSSDGASGLTFNGEIYSYLELKAELESLGLTFQTESDTEVLLAALRLWRTEALPRMDAMFSFGFYDTERRELILGRDIFGEKPLYYVETAEYFAFASELHALARLPGFDARVDLDTIATFLSFQYVPSPGTIYRSARKLPPGSWLRFREGEEPVINSYFTFHTSNNRQSGRSLDELADELESILVTSLQRRLLSDVPLGAFLSGGVDSSTVAALVTRKMGRPLKTFSIGFSNHPDSEHFDAKAMADYLGTTHSDQILEGYSVDLGRHIASILDEPNADSSCVPTYLLSQFTRQFVTVALSGDGGDELFGGYGRYFVTVDESVRKQQNDASLDWWTAGGAYFASRVLVYTESDVEALLGEVPAPLKQRLAEARQRLDLDPRPLINSLREIDAYGYLPGDVLAKVDRMSMQHSLEVRAPLLGRDVANFAMRLSGDDCYQNGIGKRVLKQLACRYFPEQWVNRPKRGFGIPIDLWTADKLLPAVREVLLCKDCRLQAWISRERLASYVDRLGVEFSAYRAWSLFILENWLRTHPAFPA